MHPSLIPRNAQQPIPPQYLSSPSSTFSPSLNEQAFVVDVDGEEQRGRAGAPPRREPSADRNNSNYERRRSSQSQQQQQQQGERPFGQRARRSRSPFQIPSVAGLTRLVSSMVTAVVTPMPSSPMTPTSDQQQQHGSSGSSSHEDIEAAAAGGEQQQHRTLVRLKDDIMTSLSTVSALFHAAKNGDLLHAAWRSAEEERLEMLLREREERLNRTEEELNALRDKLMVEISKNQALDDLYKSSHSSRRRIIEELATVKVTLDRVIEERNVLAQQRGDVEEEASRAEE
ncbi:hypothetical protein RI367_004401 [Sorochytrium milnesiophthora]